MSVKVVIGMGFGDEGKGITTDYLCSQDPEHTIVVRFSGGHQCGHKVMRGGVEHIFSNFGSGTLLGCPTYWSEYCTFEPVGFAEEYKMLIGKGVRPQIYVHPDSPVTTPYDIYIGRSSPERKHGSTGTGFKRTKVRHYEDKIQLTVYDLMTLSTVKILDKMDEIQKYYKCAELDMENFIAARFQIKCLRADKIFIITSVVPMYDHYVFEGNQGLMLDPDIGYMPHCTPSDCTPRNIMKMGFNIDEVYMVTRCYQTRHGNGPMTNEQYPVSLINIEHETNQTNPYQGVFRSTVLDFNQLVHAKYVGIDKVVPLETKINLVVTCTDQVSAFQYTLYQNRHVIYDTDEFVKLMGSILDINGNTYINTSPYSNTFRKGL